MGHYAAESYDRPMPTGTAADFAEHNIHTERTGLESKSAALSRVTGRNVVAELHVLAINRDRERERERERESKILRVECIADRQEATAGWSRCSKDDRNKNVTTHNACQVGRHGHVRQTIDKTTFQDPDR